MGQPSIWIDKKETVNHSQSSSCHHLSFPNPFMGNETTSRFYPRVQWPYRVFKSQRFLHRLGKDISRLVVQRGKMEINSGTSGSKTVT